MVYLMWVRSKDWCQVHVFRTSSTREKVSIKLSRGGSRTAHLRAGSLGAPKYQEEDKDPLQSQRSMESDRQHRGTSKERQFYIILKALVINCTYRASAGSYIKDVLCILADGTEEQRILLSGIQDRMHNVARSSSQRSSPYDCRKLSTYHVSIELNCFSSLGPQYSPSRVTW